MKIDIKKLDENILFDLDWHGGGVFLCDLLTHLISRYVAEGKHIGFGKDDVDGKTFCKLIRTRIRKIKEIGILIHGHKFSPENLSFSDLARLHPSEIGSGIKSGIYKEPAIYKATYVYRKWPQKRKSTKISIKRAVKATKSAYKLGFDAGVVTEQEAERIRWMQSDLGNHPAHGM